MYDDVIDDAYDVMMMTLYPKILCSTTTVTTPGGGGRWGHSQHGFKRPGTPATVHPSSPLPASHGIPPSPTTAVFYLSMPPRSEASIPGSFPPPGLTRCRLMRVQDKDKYIVTLVETLSRTNDMLDSTQRRLKEVDEDLPLPPTPISDGSITFTPHTVFPATS